GYESRLVFQGGGKGKAIRIGNTELGLILGSPENQFVRDGKDFDAQPFDRRETFDFLPVAESSLNDIDDFSIVYGVHKSAPTRRRHVPEKPDDLLVSFFLLEDLQEGITVKYIRLRHHRASFFRSSSNSRDREG